MLTAHWQDFSKWWSALSSSTEAKGISPEAEAYNWEFKGTSPRFDLARRARARLVSSRSTDETARNRTDGTKLTVKREAHSSITHTISYSVIEASPELSYSSVVSTITLWPVTAGAEEGSTFVEWTGNFSSDASADVIADARYKRRDALADLAKAVGKK